MLNFVPGGKFINFIKLYYRRNACFLGLERGGGSKQESYLKINQMI